MNLQKGQSATKFQISLIIRMKVLDRKFIHIRFQIYVKKMMVESYSTECLIKDCYNGNRSDLINQFVICKTYSSIHFCKIPIFLLLVIEQNEQRCWALGISLCMQVLRHTFVGDHLILTFLCPKVVSSPAVTFFSFFVMYDFLFIIFSLGQ